MNIGQFIQECEFYPHSSEYQELLKECYEIDLEAKYIESQEAIANCNSSMNLDNIHFYESVSKNELQTLTESLAEKAGNAWKKIKDGFFKFLRLIANAFKKFANSLKDLARKAGILKTFAEGGISQPDVDFLKEALTTKDITTFTFAITDKSKYKDLTIKYDPNVKITLTHNEERLLKIMLSSNEVQLNLKPNARKVLPTEYLQKVQDIIEKSKKDDSQKGFMDDAMLKFTLETMIAELNIMKYRQYINLRFDGSSNAVASIPVIINDIITELEKMINETHTVSNLSIAKLNELYTLVTPRASITMKIFTEFINFKKKIIEAIRNMHKIRTENQVYV